jgi:uncharacterized protein (DUF1778 family)
MPKFSHEARCDGDPDSDSGISVDELLDQKLFKLDADKFDAFIDLFEEQQPAGPALKALMKRRPLWQK